MQVKNDLIEACNNLTPDNIDVKDAGIIIDTDAKKVMCKCT